MKIKFNTTQKILIASAIVAIVICEASVLVICNATRYINDAYGRMQLEYAIVSDHGKDALMIYIQKEYRDRPGGAYAMLKPIENQNRQQIQNTYAQALALIADDVQARKNSIMALHIIAVSFVLSGFVIFFIIKIKGL